MAVEIPVIIDIEKAFRDAAAQTSQAIRPLQQAIDEHVLEVPVTINRSGDLKEVLDFVGKTSLSMNDLKYAIKSVSGELARLKRTGASQQDIETYTKAVALLKSIRAEWQMNERLAARVGDEELRALQIEQQYNEALQLSASSLNNINAKIAGYTAMLNNSDIGSAKFEEAAIQIGKMSRLLQTVQANVKILGTNTGSIDNLNAKIQLLNQQWAQMAANRKFTADGKLTGEAQALLSSYKKLSAELKTQGMSMADLVAKEQQRIQKHQQYLTNRKKENAILNTTIKTVDALQAKINVLQSRLNKTQVGTSAFSALNQRLRETQQELAVVQQRMSTVGVEAQKADATFSRLLKRTAYFFSLSLVTRFVRNIRQVTAEFELQRVALGGIIQDTEQANTLFRQIKAAAIESPFEIKDLVSYTKQLSAYRVETENLFDVTMRLADVSAGLGVDMSRLILAYGQVRAASVLRGQELRQFTEAGIPLVDLLAKKFQELNGRMVSTAEVFDLISKRAVPFEMISEIFEDMTSKGGTFYKMQEKQAETLAGQWSNLKDAASIMYDEIGNTDVVHKGMTRVITDTRTLMQNWRSIGTVLGYVGAQFGIMKIATLFLPNLTYNTALAEKANLALARAEQLETAQQVKSNAIRGITIKQLQAYSAHMLKAANAQTLLARTGHQIAASFLGGGWIGLATTALTVLVGWFVSARKEANRLNNELNKIGTEGALQINRSVSNFQKLANAAVEAADGSNEQNEALAELQRTYSDIIPSQNLQIDRLRELKGNYESLTSAIEQKINMQIREQKVNATTDAYAKDIQKNRRKTKNLLIQYGLDKDQANAVMNEIQKEVDSGLLSINTTINDRIKIIESIIKRLTGMTVSLGQGFTDAYGEFHYEANEGIRRSLSRLVDVYAHLNKDVEDINNEMADSIGTMGVYAKSWETLQKDIKGVTVSTEEFGDKLTFSYKKEKVRKQVELMAQAIQEAFAETDIDISKAFDPKGLINFDFLNEAAAGSNRWGLQSFIKHVQDSYESVVPTNKMVSVVEHKFQEIANVVGLSMNDVQGYLLRGEKNMQDYAKEVATDLEEAQHKVFDLQKQMEDFSKHPGAAMPVSDEDVTKANSLVEFLTLLLEWLSEYKKTTGGRQQAYVQDPMIKQMQERMKFMKDFQKGYDDLRKYLEKSSALGRESGIMMSRGLSLGLDTAEQQRAAEDLSGWYKDTINKVFDYLKTQKGVSGTLTEFLSRQITGGTNRDKMLKDFQSLLQSLFDAKTDLDTTKVKDNIDEALKKVSDELKRSETARNFYNNILNLTGDEDLAATMSVSVYGGIGDEFKQRMQTQLNSALETLKAEGPVSADLEKAFKEMDFEKILGFEGLPEKVEKIVREAYESTQKYSAEQIKTWLKELEKFETYGEKRVQLAKQTAQKIAEINASSIPEAQKTSLITQYQRKEAEQVAKLQYEAFKDSPMYVDMFENLEAASMKMLTNMRDRLIGLKEQWKDLDPMQLREMQRRIEEIDTQISAKNPFKTLIEGFKQYRDLARTGTKAGADLAAITAEQNRAAQVEQLEVVSKQYQVAKDEYQQALETLGVNSQITDEKQAAYEAAKAALAAQQAITDAAKDEADEAQRAANKWQEAGDRILKGADGLQKWSGYISDALGGIQEIVDVFATDDFADTFGIIASGIGKTMSGATDMATGIGKALSGDVIGGTAQAIKGLGSMISGIFGTGQQLKIKRINKQIEEQDRLINAMEHSYNRLGKAMEDAFGSDYIYNYNKQLEALRAQMEAYQKQAQLESQKGKKKDQKKIEEYNNAARDVQDQITDMEGMLAEFMSGTDLTSAAKDFAESWIEAYKQFGSTTDAMKEKFQDMVENMVVNSLAAQLIQSVLRPVFDAIDTASKDGELTAQEIGDISAMLPERMEMIDASMNNMMNELLAAGINLRDQAGSMTGISRDIAGASEESILGLTAGINTQNFYMQHIDMNVAMILATLTGGTTTAGSGTTGEYVDPYKDQMLAYVGTLPQMRDEMASIRAMLERVIRPVGAAATYYVSARM